jgi:hypothetical protein
MRRVKGFNVVLGQRLQFVRIQVRIRVGVNPEVELVELDARNLTV